MAQKVTDTKLSSSGLAAAPHGNGTATLPRPAPHQPARRGSGVGVWITLAIILVVIAAAGYYFFLMPKPATPGTALGDSGGKGGHHGAGGGANDKIRVITATATTGDMPVYLTGLGAVTPLNTVSVQSRVSGQLMSVDYTEGQNVKVGDKLLDIDDRPFKVTLQQNIAQKEHDQALLDNANIDLARYQTLWKQNSIPQQTLATQQSLVAQDQGTVDLDQATIDATKLNIEYCHIASPIDGRVGLRLVDIGNYIQASSTSGLLVVTQVQPITVIFTIPEDSIQPVLDQIKAGTALAVEAFARGGFTEKLATGQLLTVDTQIDPSTGTLKLRANFENKDGALFPNQFVNVRLLVNTKKNIVLVPVPAIQHGNNGTFVYVVNTDEDTVSLKPVTVGSTSFDGASAEITNGVSEGDVVVTDGVDKLKDGSKIIISRSGGNSQGGPGGDNSTNAPSATPPTGAGNA